MVEGIFAEGAVLEFVQLQLFEKGGLVMLLIGVLSIIAAVIVIERLLYFRGAAPMRRNSSRGCRTRSRRASSIRQRASATSSIRRLRR